jgi:hypothetical protein
MLTDQEKISEEVDVIISFYEEALQFYKVDPTERPLTEVCGLKARTIMSDMELIKKRFAQPTTT